MAPNLDGKIEYSVKISKFQNVNKLIIYFTNEILDKISISYICLKGIKTNVLYFIIPFYNKHYL